jgi:hypothetical protein
MKTICCVCGDTIKDGEPKVIKGRAYVSHGLCPGCADKAKAELEAEG